MKNPTMSIPFAEPEGGETRWIRLEQVEMRDAASTLAEAADLVDALFGVVPCDNGLGSGGEEFDADDLPEESEYLGMARERLPLDVCDDQDWWECEMDVLRSHQDDAYTLESATAKVLETRIMRKTVTERVTLDGATHDLAWPYAGNIAVYGAGAVVADVRGSTLNLAAPVKGRVRIRYQARWDRVKLRVSRGRAWWREGNRIQQILAGITIVGGSSAPVEDTAVVTAFWRDLAASCDVTRPPDDDTADAAELRRICNPDTDWHLRGECWQTVQKVNVCNCSGEEAKEQPEPEDRDAPCPDGVRPGSSLGVVREPGEYVDCPGEDKEGLNDPEFFRGHCCEEEPYSPLPRCRETREPYQGGEGIEGGPERWKNIYGESVRLIPVTPEGGRCGEIIKTWAVPDVVEPPPVLPEKLAVDSGKTFSVTVLYGGRPPFTWLPPTGVTHIGTAGMGFIGIFRADDPFYGGELRVLDACGREASVKLQSCGWVDLLRKAYNAGLEPRNYRDRDKIIALTGVDPFDPPGQPYMYFWDSGIDNVFGFFEDRFYGAYGKSCDSNNWNDKPGQQFVYMASANKRYVTIFTVQAVNMSIIDSYSWISYPSVISLVGNMLEEWTNNYERVCARGGGWVTTAINRTRQGFTRRWSAGSTVIDTEFLWHMYITQLYEMDC